MFSNNTTTAKRITIVDTPATKLTNVTLTLRTYPSANPEEPGMVYGIILPIALEREDHDKPSKVTGFHVDESKEAIARFPIGAPNTRAAVEAVNFMKATPHRELAWAGAKGPLDAMTKYMKLKGVKNSTDLTSENQGDWDESHGKTVQVRKASEKEMHIRKVDPKKVSLFEENKVDVDALF